MNDSQTIAFRVTPDVRKRLEDLASANDRTISQEIRRIIRAHLESLESSTK